MTFKEAADLHARARDKANGKPIANNTRMFCRKVEDPSGWGAFSGYDPVDIYSPDFYYAIRFHATDVVGIYADGSYMLNTGGWRTVTTMQRINSYLPEGWMLTSERNEWHLVTTARKKTGTYGEGEPWEYTVTRGSHYIRFEESMIVTKRGVVVDVPTDRKNFQTWMRANRENWAEGARERARERYEQSREKVLAAFVGAGTAPVKHANLRRLALGEPQPIPGHPWAKAQAQALLTATGKPIATIYPQRGEEWHGSLLSIANDGRANWEELALLGAERGHRIVFLPQAELEYEIETFRRAYLAREEQTA